MYLVLLLLTSLVLLLPIPLVLLVFGLLASTVGAIFDEQAGRQISVELILIRLILNLNWTFFMQTGLYF